MKVYMVTLNDYDTCYHPGVYSTREKAEAECARLNAIPPFENGGRGGGTFEVDEVTVQ